MIVYQDIFTEDELISDSYKHEPVIDEDGEEVPGLFEVESRTIAVGGDNVDIGCGNAFGGEEEELDDNVEKENNIISESAGFGYTEMPFNSKAEFKAYLKDYVRKVRSKMKSDGVEVEKIKQMMAEAPIFVKWLISMYSELQFYCGRAVDPEATMVFAYYKGENINPHFVYMKWGLKEVKF
mmetsp:Transcript_5097/g.7041  ORF Transcript_5097/g.7041 Transcript_5097/m.7041 type:complete len:181 (+) Transcript_5097:141-683(+)|eukprot:CAMPEP_0117760590 /NCGR_PEP_ID=MMETSP0947-20121206/16723_1 /TAXON_ID=44440 /ORGANISM="Chattonella subsalsa, Strain CCMP2191" /LENGTH=180 /DNA_ID=CAMNT_0005581315 /DNA_START=93 /DNA_END=635 /DNA_ORIENTATION=-